MDEEDKIRLLADELLKKEQSIKFKDIPIELAVNPKEGYVRGGIGNQNITLNEDASAIIEKEIDLDKNMRALVAHELRKGGKEGTSLQLETPNFNIRGSTDWNNEELASISGRIKTPVGTIGGRYNTNFAKNKNGEIFWLSPDGKWNATGSTNLEDVKKLNLEYNTDKFNIGLDMDSMGNEYLEGEYRPSPYINLGGGTDFGENRNIYAGVNYPINDDWKFDARLGRRENQNEDENEFLFNFRRGINN